MYTLVLPNADYIRLKKKERRAKILCYRHIISQMIPPRRKPMDVFISNKQLSTHWFKKAKPLEMTTSLDLKRNIFHLYFLFFHI